MARWKIVCLIKDSRCQLGAMNTNVYHSIFECSGSLKVYFKALGNVETLQNYINIQYRRAFRHVCSLFFCQEHIENNGGKVFRDISNVPLYN